MSHLPNLLIVDDIKENVVLLKELVGNLNINLIQANSGFEALEKTRGIELALALIDVWMPEMNGYELAAKINEDRQENIVPIMFITANMMSESELIKGYSSGAVDYIFKPINRTILLSKIKIFLTLFNNKQTISRYATERKIAEEDLRSTNEQLHDLAKHVEEIRETERVNISRNLHDDLGQSLTAVKIDLGIIKRQVNNEDVVLKINKVSSLVGETIKTVQRITSELRPQIIDDLGLITAIEWHTKEFTERTKIEISLDLDADILFSPDSSLTLFRIMQESLTNIARHSKATQINIELYTKNNFIFFNILDNGIGISKKQIDAKNSFGLLGMKERTISLGGSFYIGKADKTGTIIKLKLPINNKQK